MITENNSQSFKENLKTPRGVFTYFSLPKLKSFGIEIQKLPYSIRILLENVLRNFDGENITFQDIRALANCSKTAKAPKEILFTPGRVILQDFTGVPCIVDLAAMREAMKAFGGDYQKINPQVPCDLIIDHSVQTDFSGSRKAYQKNLNFEFKRNQERYAFLKWGQRTFKNFRVIPPSNGIIHQINLEFLAQGVLVRKQGKNKILFPDSLIGTDSHTTMINGLGILGWGVGGIEAEAVMLGEPMSMLCPQVIGFHLQGKLRKGVMPTDLVLAIVEKLRKEGVVGKFIEYFGDGLDSLTVANRAMIANMAPEYGATVGFFPVDEKTLAYYYLTGRKKSQIDLLRLYCQAQGMFYSKKMPVPEYAKTVELDLSTVQLSLAGPKRPQDRIALGEIGKTFQQKSLGPLKSNAIVNGSVVLAAITSCTNTSDPEVLIGAGLLAKKAFQKGLTIKSYVKASLAPGSRAVTAYLKKAGLFQYFEKMGFYLAGYGCMTCIGNSGPLLKKISNSVKKNNLVVSSVTSGNRNFEGRIHPLIKENYLCSPLLVIAYAIAGNITIDLTQQPIGKDQKGRDVFLSDLWPTPDEINALIQKHVRPALFKNAYSSVCDGITRWKKIKTFPEDLFPWSQKSTYIQKPPFFEEIKRCCDSTKNIQGARVLALFGHSVTTDHISPAGSIDPKSPAGKYLKSLGLEEASFNSYGSRRGNDQVMVRGTFANIRIKNQLVSGKEGSWTRHFPSGKEMDIFSAAQRYKQTKTPLIVIAGAEYGTGSSRDWAAKGPALLGVRVVLAESFERIHRSNLAGMGILPVEFINQETFDSLGLIGDERFDFLGLDNKVTPRQILDVRAENSYGRVKKFCVKVRLDTCIEVEYYKHGGILPKVLRKFF